MAITTIGTVNTTDTFEKQRTQVNLGLEKLDNIDLDKNTLILEDSTEPANTSVAAGSFSLYMEDSTGDLFVAIKKSTDTDAKKFRLVEYSNVTTDGTSGPDYDGTLS